MSTLSLGSQLQNDNTVMPSHYIQTGRFSDHYQFTIRYQINRLDRSSKISLFLNGKKQPKIGQPVFHGQ